MYKVVFKGQIVGNRNAATVKKNLAKFFKLDKQGIEKLFSGSSVVFKKTDDKELAFKFKSVMEKAGALCELAETEDAKPASPVAGERGAALKKPADAPAKDEMECPRCGFKQEESPECIKCGVIFSKIQIKEVPIADGEAPELKSQDRRGSNNFNYYETSGAFGVLAIPLGLAFGGVTTGVLAYVYQLIVSFNPFIYLNFAFSVFFGMAIGASTGFGLVLGKSRNMGLNLLLAVVLAGVGYYLTFKFGYENSYQVEEMVEAGWSTSYRFLPLLTITGSYVYLVWVIEALIIVGSSLGIGFMITNKPFCERCGEWTKKTNLGSAKSVDVDAIKLAVEKRDLDSILEFKRSINSETQLNMTMHSCPKCKGWNLVSMAFKWDELNDGKLEEKTEEIDGFIILRQEELAKLKGSIS